MNNITTLRRRILALGAVACVWSVAAQTPPAQTTQSSEATSAALTATATPDAVPSTNVNVSGTYGSVIVEGNDISFTGSGVVLRPTTAKPYVVAQTPPWGGFVVGSIAGEERFIVRETGVGIGTLSPQGLFHVNGAGNFGAVFRNVHDAYPWGHGLLLQMSGNSSIEVNQLRLGQQGVPLVASMTGDLLLTAPADKYVSIGSASAPGRLLVTGTTRFNDIVTVGTQLKVEGTSSPSSFAGNVTIAGNLNVNGDVIGTRVLNATYRDVAEWVDSDEDLRDGTVVIVAPDRTDGVVASQLAYDTRVAGVVSPEPGVLLGIPGEGKVKIATTGRVRVRVDATKHPIAMGDLLVSSAKPGVAMKSMPLDLGGVPIHRPGTLIGKALEPLASGEGEILVLLSLQ